MLDRLPSSLLRILRGAPELAHSYLVGGCVRDWLLGVPVKDFDVEVFGLGYEKLAGVLSRWGRADLVGRSFGVVKLSVGDEVFDFSVPRRDSKVAPGHKGFAVEFDPALTPRDAAARRDFTVNALMFDPHRGEMLDFFGGEADLRARVLRHTGAAFAEDPLRVLRGMQFAARFGLDAAPETVALCRSIAGTFPELATERVLGEWMKWATRATVPSAGLRLLRDCGWIGYFPEIAALIGVPQDPEWHPEGDVWTHTLHGLDALVGLDGWREADEQTRAVLSFAVLAHDLAKPAFTRTVERDGRERVVSPGHEAAGGPLAELFLLRLGVPNILLARVPPLVADHLAHLDPATPRMVRRLADRLAPANIRELAVVMVADAFGRPPRPQVVPDAVSRLLDVAAQLDLQSKAPRPVLLGRHLIERGRGPGIAFKAVLEDAFEAQLEGAFTDLAGAQAWLAERLAEDPPPPPDLVSG
ncbi:MAG: polynucleotide adenylyltransferase [Verrucomicrobiota bacterium]